MLEQTLQALYDSEINVTISTFWDGGIDVKLGDECNGFVWADTFMSYADIETALVKAVKNIYPKSQFVTEWLPKHKPKGEF